MLILSDVNRSNFIDYRKERNLDVIYDKKLYCEFQMKITLISTIFNLNPFVNIYIESINRLSSHDFSYLLIDANSSDDIKTLVFDKINLSEKRLINLPDRENYFNSIIHGIRLTKTEYFFILDTDDAIKIETIDLFNLCIENNKNIDLFLFREEIGFCKNIVNPDRVSDDKLDLRNLMNSFLLRTTFGSMTSKLVRKDLFKNLLEMHVEIKYSPDILLTFLTYHNSRRVLYVNKNYHIQNIFNSKSLNRNYNNTRFDDYLYVYQYVIQNIHKNKKLYEQSNNTRFVKEIFYDFVMTHKFTDNSFNNANFLFLTQNIDLIKNIDESRIRKFLVLVTIRSRIRILFVLIFRMAYKTKFRIDYINNYLIFLKNKMFNCGSIYDFNNNSAI